MFTAENTALLIYLATRADDIKTLLSFTSSFLVFLWVAHWVYLFALSEMKESEIKYPCEYKNQEQRLLEIKVKTKQVARWGNIILLLFILSALIRPLIPNTNEILLMFGGQAAAAAVTSKPVKDVAGKLEKLINKKLDEELAKPAKEGNENSN